MILNNKQKQIPFKCGKLWAPKYFNMKTLWIAFILLLCHSITRASHLAVGEMTYKHLGNDLYEITLTLYRDCRLPSQGGGNPAAIMGDDPAYISIYRGTQFYQADSVFSTNQQTYSLSGDYCYKEAPNTCISQLTFVFTKQLPASSEPYTILNERCCMNEEIANILSPDLRGNHFMCIIPPSNLGKNSSAVFKKATNLFLCRGKAVKIDHSATDADGDSLSYSLCEAWEGGRQNDPKPFITDPVLPPLQLLPLVSPFTWLLPMKNISIDPVNGQLQIEPQEEGHFLVSVCCLEWRNGVVISTTNRQYVYDVEECDLSTVASIACDSVLLEQSGGGRCLADCSGTKTISFQNTSQGGLSYFWDFGDTSQQNDTSSLQNPVYTYPAYGSYQVRLIVFGKDCNDTIEKEFILGQDSVKADFVTGPYSCTGIPIQFTDQSYSHQDAITHWLWKVNGRKESDIQNPNLTFLGTTDYQVQLIAFNSIGCYDAAETTIQLTKPEVRAFEDTTVPPKSIVQLYATGADQYVWETVSGPNMVSGTGAHIQPPTFFFGETYYLVTGTRLDGCIGRDSVRVLVTKGGYFIVPNAFSPNGDGLNDVLHILSSGYTLKLFKIYNRRGQEVFSSRDMRLEWDGRFKGSPVGMDTYYWYAEVGLPEGITEIKKGDIIVVR